MVNDKATLNVRGMDRKTVEQIKALGKARGWTIPQTIEAIVGAVEAVREANDEHPDPAVTAVLEETGLAYVRV